jgi:hypothetical protein
MRSRCPPSVGVTPVALRRGGHVSASVASCRPAVAQGYRLPARGSILRTAMTDARVVSVVLTLYKDLYRFAA